MVGHIYPTFLSDYKILDEAGSIDDDGQSRGSKSNYSEVDDQEERLDGSSSSSVSDHLSSFQGSAGTHVDLDREQVETDSIGKNGVKFGSGTELVFLTLIREFLGPSPSALSGKKIQKDSL